MARRPSASAAVDAQAPGPGRHQVRLIFSALMVGMLLAAIDRAVFGWPRSSGHCSAAQ
jgi:hypothetical protein